MWNPGTIGGLLAEEQYKGSGTTRGRIGQHTMQAVVRAARDNQSWADQPNPIKSTILNANDTAQVLRSGAGRLYHVRVTNTDNEEVVVVLTDGGNTIIVGGGVCPAQIAAVGAVPAIPGELEFCFGDSFKGNGQKIITDLRVRAFKSADGTTAADAGVTVTALTSGS